MPGSRPPPPMSAIQWCQDVTRQHSQTFYLASRAFPARQRGAVWAVYAACRVGDDLADDEQVPNREAELVRWWESVQRAFAGESGDTPMQQALCWAAGQYPIPLGAFHELYEGFLMDLQDYPYHTMHDLTLYCRRVAGVVGFMIAPIGGYRGGPGTLDAALALGQAMQLTNILRDVGEDLGRGRLYLPRELLDAHHVNVADLHAGRVTPEYAACVRELTQLARTWYAQGRAGVPNLRGPGRLAVGYAARLYSGILDDLERSGGNNLSRRAHVPGRRKLYLAWLEFLSYSPPAELCPVTWAETQYLKLRGSR